MRHGIVSPRIRKQKYFKSICKTCNQKGGNLTALGDKDRLAGAELLAICPFIYRVV